MSNPKGVKSNPKGVKSNPKGVKSSGKPLLYKELRLLKILRISKYKPLH